MGWTYYNTHSLPVNRKEECRRWWDEDRYEVLKDAMVGSTWYAAVRKKQTGEVFAAVFLTHVDGYDFGYKDMDETVCPSEVDCPASILKMLTPTTSEYALQWRAACEEKRREEAAKERTFKNAAYNSVLRAVLYNGAEFLVVKRPASHQFKTDWLQVQNENKYVKKANVKELKTLEETLFT